MILISADNYYEGINVMQWYQYIDSDINILTVISIYWQWYQYTDSDINILTVISIY